MSAIQATANSSSASGFWNTTNQIQLKQSGNWPVKTVDIEYLVVAGGGGSGSMSSGCGVSYHINDANRQSVGCGG